MVKGGFVGFFALLHGITRHGELEAVPPALNHTYVSMRRLLCGLASDQGQNNLMCCLLFYCSGAIPDQKESDLMNDWTNH